jgi:hypothetical protein
MDPFIYKPLLNPSSEIRSNGMIQFCSVCASAILTSSSLFISDKTVFKLTMVKCLFPMMWKIQTFWRQKSSFSHDINDNKNHHDVKTFESKRKRDFFCVQNYSLWINVQRPLDNVRQSRHVIRYRLVSLKQGKRTT